MSRDNVYLYKAIERTAGWMVFLAILFGVPAVAEAHDNYNYLWMWLSFILWWMAKE